MNISKLREYVTKVEPFEFCEEKFEFSIYPNKITPDLFVFDADDDTYTARYLAKIIHSWNVTDNKADDKTGKTKEIPLPITTENIHAFPSALTMQIINAITESQRPKTVNS